MLRDPGHLDRLLDFAEVSEEESHASVLPRGLGVPPVWPEWAYGDELNASQKKIAKGKQDDRSKIPKEAVDFVPARSAASGSTAVAANLSGQSASERVMAGLDKQPTSRASSHNHSKRKDLERDGGRELILNNRRRSKSRSPKRRRSRSRERP